MKKFSLVILLNCLFVLLSAESFSNFLGIYPGQDAVEANKILRENGWKAVPDGSVMFTYVNQNAKISEYDIDHICVEYVDKKVDTILIGMADFQTILAAYLYLAAEYEFAVFPYYTVTNSQNVDLHIYQLTGYEKITLALIVADDNYDQAVIAIR